MPMANVFMPKGALTRAQVELLTGKLTHELLVIEGVITTPRGRSLGCCFMR